MNPDKRKHAQREYTKQCTGTGCGSRLIRHLDPLLRGLVDERLVNVGDDTTASDGGFDQRVEFLISSDGEL